MKHYTGVGSRSTPPNIQELMTDLAFKLSQNSWVLRSGGAEGADVAFEQGALNSFADYLPEIYLPWITFNNHDAMSEGIIIPNKFHNWDEAQAIACEIHPAWNNLSPAAKTLHTRNVYQVLGKDLSSPSKFLLCWAEVDRNNVPKGGTRTSWVLAQERGIPCFNLFLEKDKERIEFYLDED